MSTATEDALLLRVNKESQVQALNELGFTEITMETPLSTIAEYMRWAGGLRDITLATVLKSTNKQHFFTTEEWKALSSTEQQKYCILGARIRAERQDFIIAREDCTSSSGSKTFTWGPTDVSVPGLQDYGATNEGVYDTFNGAENSAIISAYAASSGKSFPANAAATSYKAAKQATHGYEDPTDWFLPSLGQLMFFYRYRTEIDAFFTAIFNASTYNLAREHYWSSTEYSAADAWNVFVSYVNVWNSKSAAGWVRACSAVKN